MWQHSYHAFADSDEGIRENNGDMIVLGNHDEGKLKLPQQKGRKGKMCVCVMPPE